VTPKGPPIIVLGAARSGTRLLRSVIAADPSVAEVPFDVGYIWRFRNERTPHDEFPGALARDDVAAFIRGRLPRIAEGEGDRFVEKTVGNSLRPAFVRAVYPEARIVVLVRDPHDVVESAMRSWRTPPEAAYLWRKLRTLPPVAGLPYAAKYVERTVQRSLGRGSAPVWGPIYDGMVRDAQSEPLHVVCARQWVACARALRRGASDLGEHHLVRYEGMVRDPGPTLEELAAFGGLASKPLLTYARRWVDGDRVGGGRSLTSEVAREVAEIVRDERDRWGYGSEPTHRG
jgi:hypothetical protein